MHVYPYRMAEEHRAAMHELEDRLSATELQVQEKESLLKLTQEDLNRQKEANVRAPSTTMKNMIERLKNEVALKEKQLKVSGGFILTECLSMTVGLGASPVSSFVAEDEYWGGKKTRSNQYKIYYKIYNMSR